ncbi:hypothetical protein IJ750_03485 [bacterium]|nr:hypothetical protein [bacterium]
MNADTLNFLYQKGIIDYTPYEILYQPAGNMSFSNPYLDMAKQGMAFQSSTNASDTFSMSNGMNTVNGLGGMNGISGINGVNSMGGYGISSSTIGGNQDFSSMYQGLNTSAALNAYSSQQIGTKSTTSFAGSLGFDGTGKHNNNGITGGYEQGIGVKSSYGISDTFGGFGDAQNALNGGISSASSVYQNTPNFIKGLIGLGILFLTGAAMIKGKPKKAPAQPKTSFWSKLNIFKKNK